MSWGERTAVRPQPYAEGYEGYFNGDSVDMCRHTGADADDWKAGWRKARADDRRAELAEAAAAERGLRPANHHPGGLDG